MRLIIKNVEDVYIGPAAEPSRVNVHVSGIEPDDVLSQIDISHIINYYGITELLDFIGDQEVRYHLTNSEEPCSCEKKQ